MQHFHDGVEALLCHCELQEHTPDLLTADRRSEEGRAVMSTIPVSFIRRPCRVLARDLPETTLRATSRRPTTRPSSTPFTWAVVWPREAVHGGVNHPHIDGMQGVRGSNPLSSTHHRSAGQHHCSAIPSPSAESVSAGWGRTGTVSALTAAPRQPSTAADHRRRHHSHRPAGGLDEHLNARGISLVFAELKDPVGAKIERYELT